jgi:hypothetical protein
MVGAAAEVLGVKNKGGKSLTKLFDFERNQPCPCGSGKKFKRCCQSEVDGLYRFWRQWEGGWLTPAFAKALAACGGLQPHEDAEEVLPERAALEAALRRIREALSGDDAGTENALAENGVAFDRLLQDDEYFRHLRLGAQDVDDLLKRLDAAVPESETADQDRAARLSDVISSWLAEHTGPNDRQVMITRLWRGLRRRQYAPEDLAALLLALYLEIEGFPAHDSPFWFIVARLSVAETLRAHEELNRLAAEMRTAEPGDDSAAKEFMALVERYPSLAQRLSQGVWEAAAPVLSMLVKGEIPLSVPAYTVFDGLWCSLFQVAGVTGLDAMPAKSGKELCAALASRLDKKAGDQEWWWLLAESAWDRDYALFTPAFCAVLDAWLEGPGREYAEADRQAVDNFRGFFGDLMLPDTAKIHLMVYILALGEVLRRQEAALPVPGEQDVPDLTFAACFTLPGLERYAAYLEEKGQTTAAAHVRAVGERYGAATGAAE